MSKRPWFRNSKKEIWQQLADELGGIHEDGSTMKPGLVRAWHMDWEVVLDTYTVSNGKSSTTFTRLRAPYVNRDDFVFRIFRRNVFTDIGKTFGMQDVEVGYPEFDRDFVIQGNDERKLKMMFEHGGIRELISFQSKIDLKIREDEEQLFQPKFPPDVNELYYQTLGVLTDLRQLMDLYELFAITLDHLCEIGTAYEDDPGEGW
ncbi:MAG: DUF3137 domain-containing protein [Bacteroidia bacterium]|nr:DUF3137 domain-containing protein [Bacteroidia bacterium]